jgi:uncharacterized protein YjgD (DUF1641 family)/nucleotide-binding universal stress UspA family protein
MTPMGSAVAEAPSERLMARLNDERTVEALEKLLDHAELLAFGAQALDGLVRRGEELAENLGAGVAELRTVVDAEGGSAKGAVASLPRMARVGAQLSEVAEGPGVQRLLQSGVLEKLGEPKTLEALETLAKNAELIAFAVQALDGFLRRGDEVAEAMAESVGDLRAAAKGTELGTMIPRLQQVAKKAMEHHTLEAITQLTDAAVPVVESGLLHPSLVRTVADVGAMGAASYQEAMQAPPTAMGPMALWRALKEPTVQRALGFGVALVRAFGKRLDAKRSRST